MLASQWRAISSRVASQAPPLFVMCSSMRSSAPMRPGRPIMRRCRPDRQHPRTLLAFAPQPVVRRAYVVGKVLRRCRSAACSGTACRWCRTHRAARRGDARPTSSTIRRVVVVGVAVVEEAVLGEQAPGVGRGVGPRVPADRGAAGGGRDRIARADDGVALLRRRRGECPVPSASRDPTLRGPAPPHVARARASARPRGRRRSACSGRHGARRARRRASSATRVPYSKWLSMQRSGMVCAVDDFVDRFVVIVAIGHRELGALLEVDDERHRHPRVVRPAHRRWDDCRSRRSHGTRVSGEVGSVQRCCHRRALRTARAVRMPTIRSAAKSTTMASRMRQDEMAAIVGSGDSSR